MSEDAILLEKIQSGDRNAFDTLVGKYQRELYFLALRMVKNQEDAEDLAQQAFVKAFEKLDSFKGKSSFKTWLYQVAINLCRSFLRSRKPDTGFVEEMAAEEEDESAPLLRVLKNETAGLAARAVSQLPEKQRIAVTLRIVHEMSYKEIGDAADCSEQTAKVNFHYGIENLRKKLRESGVL